MTDKQIRDRIVGALSVSMMPMEMEAECVAFLDRCMKVPKWIPVAERLPEECDGTILLCYPDIYPYNDMEPYRNAKHNRRVRTGKYSQFSKRWYVGDVNGVGRTEPIAWMPLPEPPKDVTDINVGNKKEV